MSDRTPTGPAHPGRDGGSPSRVSGGVAGLFHDPGSVTRAVERLAEKSVPADTIHVYVLDAAEGRKREISVEDESGTLRGALIGAGFGAAVGLAIVVATALGAFGPIGVDPFGMTTLLGAVRAIAIAAVAGVPLGALIGMGHWAGRKKLAEDELESHGAIVVVESDELSTVAREVLRSAGAERVSG